MTDDSLPLFKTKICGVTRPIDARAVATSGADAIGLNFYESSKRFVTDEAAQLLVAALADAAASTRIQTVGVFVNESPAEVRRRAESLDLDWVQLHGDEPPAEVAELLKSQRVIRALAVGPDGLESVLNYLAECRRLGGWPSALLLDAASAGQYGGTGQTLEWRRLATELAQLPDQLPWILAGGLNPDNVADAIRCVGPDAVDTASGVEVSAGVKDPERIRQFVQRATARLPSQRPLVSRPHD